MLSMEHGYIYREREREIEFCEGRFWDENGANFSAMEHEGRKKVYALVWFLSTVRFYARSNSVSFFFEKGEIIILKNLFF